MILLKACGTPRYGQLLKIRFNHADYYILYFNLTHKMDRIISH